LTSSANICNKDDQTTTLNTPSELSNKDKDTNAKDGDVGSNYGEVSQSTGVEASTSYPIYDDAGVLAPNYDVDSTPYPIYDIYDDAGMIVPEYDLGVVTFHFGGVNIFGVTT
jgi:hypothetical protein